MGGSALMIGILLLGCRMSETRPDRDPDNINGVYIQRNAATPEVPFRLEIRPQGKWAMTNTLTGLWGTWEVHNGNYRFIQTDGPTGAISPVEVGFEFKPRGRVAVGPIGRTWEFERVSDGPFTIPTPGSEPDLKSKQAN